MKLVKELIEYLSQTGKLTLADFTYLRDEGFISLYDFDSFISTTYEDPEFEESDESVEYTPQAYLTEDDLYAENAEEELVKAKKGKGGYSKKRLFQEKFDLNGFNDYLLFRLSVMHEPRGYPIWVCLLYLVMDTTPYRFVHTEKVQQEIKEKLFNKIVWDQIGIRQKTQSFLLDQHPSVWLPKVERLSLFYLEGFFHLADSYFPSRKKGEVYEWVLGTAEIPDVPNRTGFWWFRQIKQLHKMFLQNWFEVHLQLIEETGEQAKYYRDALVSQEELGPYLALFLILSQPDLPQKPTSLKPIQIWLKSEDLEFAEEMALALFPDVMLKVNRRQKKQRRKNKQINFISVAHERFGNFVIPEWADHLQKQTGHKIWAYGNLIEKDSSSCKVEFNWFIYYRDLIDGINNSGFGTFEQAFSKCSKLKDGYATVLKKDDKHDNKLRCAIFKRNGEFIFLNKAENLFEPSEGLVKVHDINVGQFHTDLKGKKIYLDTYYFVDSYSEGKAFVNFYSKEKAINLGISDNSYCIDRAGKFLFAISPEVTASPFVEGRSIILCQKGQYGILDETGKIIVEIKYKRIRSFSEGKAAFLDDDKWGFLDKKGQVSISNQYEQVGFFKEGYAPVKLHDKWGLIDHQGKIIIPVKYNFVTHPVAGFVVLHQEDGQRIHALNGDRHEKFDQTFVSVQSYDDGFFKVKYPPGRGYQYLNKKGAVVFSFRLNFVPFKMLNDTFIYTKDDRILNRENKEICDLSKIGYKDLSVLKIEYSEQSRYRNLDTFSYNDCSLEFILPNWDFLYLTTNLEVDFTERRMFAKYGRDGRDGKKCIFQFDPLVEKITKIEDINIVYFMQDTFISKPGCDVIRFKEIEIFSILSNGWMIIKKPDRYGNPAYKIFNISDLLETYFEIKF